MTNLKSLSKIVELYKSGQSVVALNDKFAVPISTTDSVFEIPNQKIYRTHWYTYCKHNNIPHITPYELRHTFVSIAKNLPEGTVKSIVGHSRNMDTFGVYGHEVNGEMEKTSDSLYELFSSILEDVL